MSPRRRCLDATYLWSGPDARALLDTRRPATAIQTDGELNRIRRSRRPVGADSWSSHRTALPGEDTLLACWRSLAKLSRGAKLVHATAATAAVFPAWAPLNNAILLPAAAAAGAAEVATELAPFYAAAQVETWALWLPSRATTFDAPDDVPAVAGLTRDTTTLVMRLALPRGLRSHAGVVRTSIASATRASDEHPVPAGDLRDPDGSPGLNGWAMVVDGRIAVAGAWSFLHGTDCGIYAVGTHPDWRRRGLARALLEHVLADARQRGARTATLQSTRMGLPLYQSLGFTPVGRYAEWTSHAR